MKIKKRILFPIILLAIIMLGPRADYPPLQSQYQALTIPIDQLDAYVKEREVAEPLLKEDNQARIIWADSVRKTPYSIVYLHGFSASPMEAAPFHIDIAQRYGANLYLARFAGHGLDTPESFVELTPNQLLQSAEEALAIGRQLGEKVILMSCSTGSTLAIYLAAQHPQLIHSLLLYSPNIALENSSAALMTMPWGKQLLHAIVGEYRHLNHMKNTPAENYWTTSYRSNGLIALKSLLEQTMKESVFSKIEQPFLMAYYYKNDKEKDKIVSVDAMLEFFEQTKTSADKKRNLPMPDVGSHVLVSSFHSKDLIGVKEETIRYLEEVLGLIPRSNSVQ